ncbi:MAG: dimethyl sulfoxide reductase anchor subunit [Candidatus Saccharicenans sp.]|nr:dimethyl sulfoxide reductase anchor subunit [Candidatus Saccharicenans sp.]
MLKLKEWPLVMFSVLVQSSVGIFIFAFGAAVLPRARENRWLFRAADRWGLALLGLVGLALLISLFHRGRSLSVYFPVQDHQPGRLNREISSLGIFFLLLVVLEFLLVMRFQGGLLAALVMLAGLSGLMVIYVMSRSHCLSGIRLWKSSRTAVFFFLTAFLVGSLTMLLFQRIGSAALMLSWLGGLYWWAAALLAGLAFIYLLLFDQVSGLFPLPGSWPFRSRSRRAVFALRLAMLLAILGLLLNSHPADRSHNHATVIFLILSLTLAITEEVLGRITFYALAESTGSSSRNVPAG